MFDAAARRSIAMTIVVGGAVGFGVLAIDLVTNNLVTRLWIALRDVEVNQLTVANTLKPGMTVGAIFLFPWGLALVRVLPAWSAITTTIAAAAALMLLGSHTVAAATVVGAVFAAVGLAQRRIVGSLLGIVLAGFVLAGPWIVHGLPNPTVPGSGLEALPHSTLHRLYIWHTSAALIGEAPWLGHGFESSRMFFGPDSMRDVVLLPDSPERGFRVLVEPIPLHPHNAILQVWLEMGLIGAALLAMTLWGIVRAAAATQDRAGRAAALGAIGSATTVAAISYGAWQSWWLATLFLTGMLIASLRRA
jgi:O-antigen ligase